VVGLDASPTAMATASLRAARSVAKGGLPNALFAVAAAESPPAELVGRADLLTVTFPWGSLLRGALAVDAAAAAGIASLLAPGARLEALVSVTDRDAAGLGIEPLTSADAAAIVRRWARLGGTLDIFEPATDAIIAASRSTWARRLAAGRGASQRPVWRLAVVNRGHSDRALESRRCASGSLPVAARSRSAGSR
jgi:16S rRNA (adenine(1408)-N(1))-methyltransferase